ncbi:endonuclease/exonuclease/phosphatase family protein [Nocardioides sp.]|uniref:endonuclease/exonuclease/phosphatase family protein n=1 Tax=Nocardioides sp. TaxID=35761 RepID=UPI00271A97AE|nr:endonuclease/exonuclease/phosphatase family protein [Nocardioides sp.]MDO9457648.1 endonuclease/exonuclease/phosphatase family protein [Nocardioides sp.]
MKARRAVLAIVPALLVVAALPVTLSRLTGWTGDLGIVLTAFAPLALLPYAVALVLLVAAVVRGRRRWPWLGATGLVVALLALHVAWFAPLVVGGAPEPAAGAERVTVLSANVEYGRGDAAVVVDAVRDRGVDVLVVSEVTPRFVAAADAAGLADVLPHRAGEAGDTTSGTMVFSSEPIEEVARVDTIFDSLVVRTHDLTLLATHPAPPQLPADWRHDQPLLLRAAREHAVDLVVGDLNATLDHPTIRDLVDAGWRDAVELTNGGWAPTWPAHGELGLPLAVVQIDHVLARDTVAVTEVDRLEVPDADHLAVVVTLAGT